MQDCYQINLEWDSESCRWLLAVVELQSYQVAGMGVFWGEDLRQRSPTGHLSKEKTEVVDLYFVGFYLDGKLWESRGFWGAVCDTWRQDSSLALVCTLSCQVYFAGLLLCDCCPPYWGFRCFLFLFLKCFFLLKVWEWVKASWIVAIAIKQR